MKLATLALLLFATGCSSMNRVPSSKYVAKEFECVSVNNIHHDFEIIVNTDQANEKYKAKIKDGDNKAETVHFSRHEDKKGVLLGNWDPGQYQDWKRVSILFDLDMKDAKVNEKVDARMDWFYAGGPDASATLECTRTE